MAERKAAGTNSRNLRQYRGSPQWTIFATSFRRQRSANENASLPLSLIGLLLCVFVSFAVSIQAAADEWKQIDPAHLALKSSTVEKEADAEVLFWEVKIDDNPEGDLIFNHYSASRYSRNAAGSRAKSISFWEAYGGETKINDIAARTIKPDGSIVQLKKDDIYERTIVKSSGLKYKAKSFAMPAVEPGCIIEYRWRDEGCGGPYGTIFATFSCHHRQKCSVSCNSCGQRFSLAGLYRRKAVNG